MENNLLPNENIIEKAKIHWAVFVPGGVFIILWFLVKGEPLVSGFFLLIGIILLLKAFLYRISTEFVVTNMRVLAKTGFIKRQMLELRHEKVEGIFMNQGILDRIFSKGTLVLNGTGGTRETIHSVCNPLQFRKQAMEAVGQKS